MKKEENSYFIFLPVLPNRDSPARITGRSRSAAYAAPGKREKFWLHMRSRVLIL